MTVFNKFIERVLGAEGGYVNDPRDPGGETNWGISKRTYPKVDIKSLTRDGAIAIYQKDFWDAIEGDLLPPIVAFQLLDMAVNQGVDAANATNQMVDDLSDDPVVQVALIIAERLDRYTHLALFSTYGRGWTRRIADDIRFAVEDHKDEQPAA